MALSPNYGWSEPDNSSLVKNGAADIRTLGDSIDTSVWNIGFGQAGKNKIINGDFSINQRSFTSATASGYTFDRWAAVVSGTGTSTFTPETFTPGTAPVAGYEGSNFARIVTTGQSGTNVITRFAQPIENVRTFAGQTATISFWAKAATGTPAVSVELSQGYGSGGSPSTQINIVGGNVTLSTSWARYSVTVAVPSLTGKTLGTTPNTSLLEVRLWVSAGSDFNARTGSLGIQSNTFDFWGVQAEYGSKATPFQTATGSIQGELQACQRYLPAISGASNSVFGYAYSTTGTQVYIKFPTTARVAATGITVNGTLAGNYALVNQGFTSGTPTVIAYNSAGTDYGVINITTTAAAPTLVTGQPAQFQTLSANGYILFTGCEL